MKRFAIVVLVFLLASVVWAQDYGKFGVGLSGSYVKSKEDNVSSSNEEQYVLFVTGSFSTMLGESLELRPSLTYGTSKSMTDGVQNAGWSYFGASFGFYWHVLKTDFFRMGPGALVDTLMGFDTYPSTDDATIVNIGIKIPMMMEFVMTKNIVFRAEYNMLLVKTQIYTDNSKNKDFFSVIRFFPTDPSAVFGETEGYLGNQIFNLGITYRF